MLDTDWLSVPPLSREETLEAGRSRLDTDWESSRSEEDMGLDRLSVPPESGDRLWLRRSTAAAAGVGRSVPAGGQDLMVG